MNQLDLFIMISPIFHKTIRRFSDFHDIIAATNSKIYNNEKDELPMKRVLALLCIVAMAFSLVACKSQSSTSKTSNQSSVSKTQENLENSYIGQVTKIDGTTITLQLGEFEQREMPENRTDTSGQEFPEQTDKNNSAPSMDMSSKPDGKELQQNGDNQRPQMPENTDGTSFPDKNNGRMMGGFSGFVAGDETLDLDLSTAKITKQVGPQSEEATLEEITVGDILVITPDETNNSYLVTIQMNENHAPSDMPQNDSEALQQDSSETTSESA